MNRLDVIENIENDLTILSAIPFIGTAPACIRIALGVVQLVAALALFLLTFSDAVDIAYPDLSAYAIEHIVHGGTNLFWGCAMAIPILGTVLFFVKKRKAEKKEDHEATPYIQFKYGTLSPSTRKRKRGLEDQTPLTGIVKRLF